MRKTDPLLQYIETFFTDYLPKSRNVSKKTIVSYRDSLKLFFCFVANSHNRSVDKLRLKDMAIENVQAFVDHLVTDRGNSIATQNCRLAAIHMFFTHLVNQDQTRAGQYGRVLSLPMRKQPKPVTNQLIPKEMAAVLKQPDQSTKQGLRDYALMLFLYNTGARISEALTLTRDRCHFYQPLQVHIKGKSRKDRMCALWPSTAKVLQNLCERFDIGSEDAIFRSMRRGGPLGYHGAAAAIKKHVVAASESTPSLCKKSVTPHVIRHSVGYALVQSGVDLASIRDILGHERSSTTDRYTTTNTETQRKTLDEFWKLSGLTPPKKSTWAPKPGVLGFLESL